VTTYVGEVRIKTRLDAAGINTGLTKVSGMLGKLALAVGVGFSIHAIVNFSKASVEAAAKSESAWAGLGFVLNANNRSLTEAKGFLEDYVSDGLVPLTDAIQAYQNMVMTGFSTDQIEDMMKVLKDSAAFGRQGQYTMGEAIEKTTQGFRMENSVLSDSAGIQKNLAKMYDDYARSIGTTANNLTRAQKNQAIYNGVMAEGGIFAGAAAKYADTYAGRISQLSTAFYNLRVAVGNAVIPILNQIIPILTNVINWFTRLFNIVGQVMNLLYGTNVSMADTASGAQDAADATGEMADNLEDANKAAKGSLAAFDKLNVLNPPEEGGGGGGEGGGGGGMPMPVPDTEPTLGALDEMEERIRAFVERVKAFFAPLGEAFGRLGEALGKVGEAVKGAFERFFPGGIDFEPFIALVRDGVIFIIDLLAKAIEGFANWINENPDAFNVLLVLFAGLAIAAIAIYAPTLLVIAAVVALLAALGWLANNWDLVKEKASEAWEIIKTAWNKAGEWFKTSVIDPIANFFKGLWEKVSGIFVNLWEDIKAIWQTAKDWFDAKVATPIRVIFTAAWYTIKSVVSGAWDGIKELWQGAKDWFTEKVLDPIKEGFTSVWEDISNVIKGVINGIIGFINGMIRGIVDGINAVIGLLNKLNFKIPDWVPGLGGKTFGFNIATMTAPQIPMLATGAVIPANAPFAAILGDQKHGTNIEAPESLLRDLIREELGRNQSRQDTIHNVIKLDGQVLYEAVKKIDKRVGTSLISGSGIR
jgi:hypothetical protein